jgi:hypothetical protein
MATTATTPVVVANVVPRGTVIRGADGDGAPEAPGTELEHAARMTAADTTVSAPTTTARGPDRLTRG